MEVIVKTGCEAEKEAERDSFLFQNAHSHKLTLGEMPRTWTETGPRERDNTSLEAHEAQIWYERG